MTEFRVLLDNYSPGLPFLYQLILHSQTFRKGKSLKAALWETPGEDLNHLAVHKSENGFKRTVKEKCIIKGHFSSLSLKFRLGKDKIVNKIEVNNLLKWTSEIFHITFWGKE